MNFLLNKMEYSLRSATNPYKKNYSEVVKLPRTERVKPKTAYSIEVVEEDGDGLEDDEWRKREDIEDLTSGNSILQIK